ncbi:reverse transcriptase domain-containing protein [Tanacetum coccineum]
MSLVKNDDSMNDEIHVSMQVYEQEWRYRSLLSSSDFTRPPPVHQNTKKVKPMANLVREVKNPPMDQNQKKMNSPLNQVPRFRSIQLIDPTDLTKDLLASLALSPFYDDPYMKIMQAYDATDNELPIPPQSPIALPTILTPSQDLSLSPMFDFRRFFPPEKISPPKDTETPVESPIPISPSSSVGSSSSHQLVADSVVAALEAQAIDIASTDNLNKNTGPRETPWNSYAKPIGIEKADKIAWTELKRLLTNKYCPRTEVKKMEDDIYSMVVKGNDLKTYARRFQELAVLCPNMVPNTEKLIEAFIGGLPRSIEGNVTASKPQTLEEAITITQRLIDQVTKHDVEQGTNDHKQKFNDRRNNNNTNYPNNHDNNNYPNDRNNNYQNNRNSNNNNRNNDYHQQQNERPETFMTYGNRRYNGPRTLCRKCTLHHTGSCTVRCQNCNKLGHQTRNWRI